MSTIYSVTQLNTAIRDLLETSPPFRNIFVQGEISNFKRHSSGHCYLSLKDADGAINAVLFRSDAMRLKFQPENGMQVIARGRVSMFPKTGAVQLYIAEMMPQGAGALQIAFEQLKKKLEAEGLFAESAKQPIPSMPRRVALVTSPTGAAVRDMIRILGRRWPLASVVLFPAQVQGAGAAESIARAIALANALSDADVILCGRGGGSMEDLWAFNEEVTARAIYESALPVISAVGHEPDVTIADFVADLRAPTPSGAAELAVPDRAVFLDTLRKNEGRLAFAMEDRLVTCGETLFEWEARLKERSPMRLIAERRLLLDGVIERLENRSPRHTIAEMRGVLAATKQHLTLAAGQQVRRDRQRLTLSAQRLGGAATARIHGARLRFSHTVATLDALSPLQVLARGYAVVRAEKKAVVDTAALSVGDTINIQFHKGAADCCVTNIKKGRKA